MIQKCKKSIDVQVFICSILLLLVIFGIGFLVDFLNNRQDRKSGATYTVEHYLQDINYDEYELDLNSTEVFLGDPGKKTAAIANTYPGYIALDFEQRTIAENDSTVVRIYYARTIHLSVASFHASMQSLTGSGIHVFVINDAENANLAELTAGDRILQQDFPVRVLLDFSNSSALTKIPVDIFSYHKNLIGIVLPDAVTEISDGAFRGCTNIKFYIAESNPLFATTADKRFLLSKDNTMLICCPSASNEICIPDTVKTIQHLAFANCKKLTRVTIPSSVTCVSGQAFLLCKSLNLVIFIDTENWYRYKSYDDWVQSKNGITIDTIPVDVTDPELTAEHLKTVTIGDIVKSCGLKFDP